MALRTLRFYTEFTGITMLRKKQSLTRAEHVRARRKAMKTKNELVMQKERDGWARSVPPVMMRADMMNAKPKLEKRKRRIKRRVDISLSSPGVEVSLPALPALSVDWRLASSVLIAGILATFCYFWYSPIYRVQAADIEGAVYLNSESMNRSLTIYNIPVFMITPRDLEVTLKERFKGISSVNIQVSFPAKVVVTIVERVPVLIWEQEGENQWVDLQGIAFPVQSDIEDLMRVQASAIPSRLQTEDGIYLEGMENQPQDFISPDMVATILMLQTQAPEGTHIVYDDLHGLGWRAPQGWDVYFGMDISDIDAKLSVYQAIQERLEFVGIKPALINVEQAHAPIYRMFR